MSDIRKSDRKPPTTKSVFSKLKQVTASPPATLGRSLTLILDRSGSMCGEPIVQLNAAVTRTIAEFSSKVNMLALTFPASGGLVPAFALSPLVAFGGTPMGEALYTFVGAASPGDHAILMSDGQPTDDPEPAVERCVERGLVVHTVACGSGADEALLRDIAWRTGGQFYRANEPIKLADAFLQLGRVAVAALTAGQKELPRG